MPLQMKYFVLKPHGKDEFAKASRAGMWAYAKAIETHDPQFAMELRHWANEEDVIARHGPKEEPTDGV